MSFTVCIVVACMTAACLVLAGSSGLALKLSNGALLIWRTVMLCLVIACVIACVALPIVGVRDWFHNRNQKQMTNFTQFLGQYDPALKSKRDEVLQVMQEIKQKGNQLREAKKNYKSKEALEKIDTTISQIEAELDQIQSALKAIDTRIEVAMVTKDIRSADAGGLKSRESRELLDSADSILRQANELQELVEKEGDPALSPK